jgi:hypothetical protein
MRVATVLLLAVSMGHSQSAEAAEDLATGLRQCSAVADSLQRLVCYDNLAKRTATRAATSATAGTAATAPQPMVGGSSSTSKSKAAVSVRCQATTKKGAQCKRNAAAGSSYCWQHGG